MFRVNVLTTPAVVFFVAALFFPDGRAMAQSSVLSPTPMAYNWSGFYFGGFGGVAETDLHVTDLFTDAFGGAFYTPGGNPYDFDAAGLFAGAQAGYDWQWGGFVAGFAGEAGRMELDSSVINPWALPVPIGNKLPKTSFTSEWFGSLTGRVGYTPMDRLLVYAKGGVAFLDAEGSTVDTCARSFCQQTAIEATGDDVLLGWTAGAGIEAAAGPHLRVGAEYRFYDFEDLEVSGIANNFLEYHQTIDVEGIHTGRFFVNFVW
jgi:outer membrane immunogenic protein